MRTGTTLPARRLSSPGNISVRSRGCRNPAIWNSSRFSPVKCTGTTAARALRASMRDGAAPGRIGDATRAHIEVRDLARRETS